VPQLWDLAANGGLSAMGCKREDTGESHRSMYVEKNRHDGKNPEGEKSMFSERAAIRDRGSFEKGGDPL